jgi:hypothetical protein
MEAKREKESSLRIMDFKKFLVFSTFKKFLMMNNQIEFIF